MKPVFTSYLVFCSFLFMSEQTYADAWVQNNTVCNWFTKRYKAHVGIKKAGDIFDYCSDTKKDCYNIEIECKKDICQDYFCGYYARAYAQINDQGSNVIEYGGFDGTDYWYAGYDVTFKRAVQSYYPMIFYKNGINRYTETGCNVKRTVFDFKNHKIRIYDINGIINLQTNDPINDFSSVVISLTKKTDSDDEFSDEVYMKNLISSSKIFVNNGILQLKGLIKKEMISIKKSGQLISASFSVPLLEIDVPIDIDLNEVSVNIGVDNGNLGFGISDKFAIENNAEIHKIAEEQSVPNDFLFIKNYPNPIETDNISVEFQLSEAEDVEVFLYDYNGKLVKTLYKGHVNKEEIKTIDNIDVSQINITGYIKIVTPKKIVTKKISKL